VILVRCPATASPAQSTDELDWGSLGLDLFADQGQVVEDPLLERVQWSPRRR
jgi:hypothetical protein